MNMRKSAFFLYHILSMESIEGENLEGKVRYSSYGGDSVGSPDEKRQKKTRSVQDG